MRMSALFSRTLRESPAEAEIESHRFLVRAGFIQLLAAGIFTNLHLGKRVLTKIENIMREQIEGIGGQEITMPIVQPAEIWQESGRWSQIGSEMGRFKDKSGRDMALAMTHEEVVADLTRKIIHSYRQLPALIYHIQTKWRDETRPRAGLIRVREFTMKDSYSLDADWEGLDRQYKNHYQAYINIFNRCGLPVQTFRSDVGVMGGTMAHEFMYLTPIGEDSLVICDHCGYAANRQIARFKKSTTVQEAEGPLEKIPTPGAKTIADLAQYLHISPEKTAKAVFYIATLPNADGFIEQLVLAILRGDMELNETRLADALHAKELKVAAEEEINHHGAVPGYASPIGLSGIFVVVDDLIPDTKNLVAGANDIGFHYLNVNYGRDYIANMVTDIALVQADYPCPDCSNPLRIERGVEVGNIFKLGTRYSEAFGCYFQDQEGNSKPIIMGSYGIGSGRLMACIAEEHHDEAGLIWPMTVAPYHVHLVLLSSKTQNAGENRDLPASTAEELYNALQAAGIETLYDDRQESAGVKFKDADLIGIPIRITVSEKSLASGGFEIKWRNKSHRMIVSKHEIIDSIKDGINQAILPTANRITTLRLDE